MMGKPALVYLLITTLSYTALGALEQRDSLLQRWNDPALPDTVRIRAYEDLIWDYYLYSSTDTAMVMAQELLDFAQQRGWAQGEERAYTVLGTAIDVSGDLRRAEAYLRRAFEISELTGNRRRLAVNYGNYGKIMLGLGNYNLAADYLFKTLRLFEAFESQPGISGTLDNLAGVYAELGDLERAIELQEQAVEIQRALGASYGLTIALNNMSSLLYRSGEFDRAIALLHEVISIAEGINQLHIKGYALHNLGLYHEKKGLLIEALDYFNQAADLRDAIGDTRGKVTTTLATGRLLYAENQIDKAAGFARSAFELADQLNQPKLQRDAAELLWQVERAQGQFDQSLALYERFISLRDSLLRDENQKAILQQQFQYDYDKREALLVAEQEKRDALAAEEMRRRNLQRNASLGGFGLMLLLAMVFFTQRRRIAKEKERSEHLLLNILPAETAEELKATGSSKARHIDQVTVLFTDFKGFTALSERLPPEELVAMINECFSAFDRITEKYGIEKIKTIGDAYMAAGGLPTPNQTHATDVVRAALDIQRFMTDFKSHRQAENLPAFEIRIGIHTGPVVAGIVGIKKFQYDIWGDTVNTAARMESSGEVGQVNISEATYAQVHDRFECTFRGAIEAKGKGKLGMYFVLR